MRWQPPLQERTFLRFLTELARLMGIPRKEIELTMAWYQYRQRGRSAVEYYLWLARPGSLR